MPLARALLHMTCCMRGVVEPRACPAGCTEPACAACSLLQLQPQAGDERVQTSVERMQVRCGDATMHCSALLCLADSAWRVQALLPSGPAE